MLNSFIISLLRGAPYYLLFNIGNLFSGLDTTGKLFSGLFSLSRAGGILGRNKEKSENMRKFVSYSV